MPVGVVADVRQPLSDLGLVEVDQCQLRTSTLHQGRPHLVNIQVFLLEDNLSFSLFDEGLLYLSQLVYV